VINVASASDDISTVTLTSAGNVAATFTPTLNSSQLAIYSSLAANATSTYAPQQFTPGPNAAGKLSMSLSGLVGVFVIGFCFLS